MSYNTINTNLDKRTLRYNTTVPPKSSFNSDRKSHTKEYYEKHNQKKFTETLLTPYIEFLCKLRTDISNNKCLDSKQLKSIKILNKSIQAHYKKLKKNKTLNYDDLINCDEEDLPSKIPDKDSEDERSLYDYIDASDQQTSDDDKKITHMFINQEKSDNESPVMKSLPIKYIYISHPKIDKFWKINTDLNDKTDNNYLNFDQDSIIEKFEKKKILE